MFYVVAYDILETRRRTRLFKLLKGFGVWNQFSLFECHLKENQYKHMVEIIEKVINKDEDNIKIYYLCKDCFNQIKTIGNTKVLEEKNTIII